MIKDFAKIKTYKELHRLQEQAETKDFSDFAKFCMMLKGYRFTDKNGKQLDKWEVYFIHECKSVFKLLEGMTDVVAIKTCHCDVID